MAVILRRSALTYLQTHLKPHKVNFRAITTSKEKKDSANTPDTRSQSSTRLKFGDGEGEKDWISYGFNTEDKYDDRRTANSTLFWGLTVVLTIGGFGWCFLPDPTWKDWAVREAYLELRRREREGLLPIDPNYVDPNTIVLPSEEELEDVEIII